MNKRILNDNLFDKGDQVNHPHLKGVGIFREEDGQQVDKEA
jgi:hypothetical protein